MATPPQAGVGLANVPRPPRKCKQQESEAGEAAEAPSWEADGSFKSGLPATQLTLRPLPTGSQPSHLPTPAAGLVVGLSGGSRGAVGNRGLQRPSPPSPVSREWSLPGLSTGPKTPGRPWKPLRPILQPRRGHHAQGAQQSSRRTTPGDRKCCREPPGCGATASAQLPWQRCSHTPGPYRVTNPVTLSACPNLIHGSIHGRTQLSLGIVGT